MFTYLQQKVKLSLTLSNVAGIFYILIVGLVLAIVLGVMEFMCFRSKTKVSTQQNIIILNVEVIPTIIKFFAWLCMYVCGFVDAE